MEDNKKKKIKQCRVKMDTCFKWHCIGKLFGLDLADIGLMYMISQIQDDESDLRYTLIEEEILDMYKSTEKEWLVLHSAKMKNDPLYRIAFSDLNGQRKATTNHYKAEVERRRAYNERVDKENGNLEENVTTSDELTNEENEIPTLTERYYFKGKILTAEYKEDKEENIPPQEELAEIQKEKGIEYVEKLIETGNKEEWNISYLDIVESLDGEEEYPI